MKKILKALGMSVVLLLIYFGFQLVTGFILAIFGAVSIAVSFATRESVPDFGEVAERLNELINGSSASILFVSAGLSLMIYILIYSVRKPDFIGLWKFNRINPVSVAVLIVFSISFSVLIEYLLSLLSNADVEIFHTLFEKYGRLMKLISGQEFLFMLLFVGILIPIFEEILFRGLILGELNKAMRARYAVFLQALIFGLSHFNIIQGIYAFLLGLSLGYIYHKSGLLLYPVIVHVTFNSFSVVMSAVSTGEVPEKWKTIVIAAGFVLFAASGLLLIGSLKKSNGGKSNGCNTGADDAQLDKGISAGSD